MLPVFQNAVEQIVGECEDVASKLFSVFDFTEDEISAILKILGDAQYRKTKKYISFGIKYDVAKMDEEEEK